MAACLICICLASDCPLMAWISISIIHDYKFPLTPVPVLALARYSSTTFNFNLFLKLGDPGIFSLEIHWALLFGIPYHPLASHIPLLHFPLAIPSHSLLLSSFSPSPSLSSRFFCLLSFSPLPILFLSSQPPLSALTSSLQLPHLSALSANHHSPPAMRMSPLFVLVL